MAMTTSSNRPTVPGQSGWWSNLQPKTKQMVMVGGAVSAFFAIMIPLMSTTAPTLVPAGKERSVGELLPASRARELGLSGLAKDVDRLEDELNKRDRELAAMRAQGGGVSGPSAADPAMVAELERLRARMELLERGEGGSLNGGVPPVPGMLGEPGGRAPTLPATALPPPVPGPAGQGSAEPAPPVALTMRTIDSATATGDDGGDAEAAPEPEAPKAYLPSGTMISGVLITGLDAATGRAASQDPTPVLVKVDAEAILPNRYSADITGCFALLAGRGDLSSERAFLRGERFSCVAEGGGVIDIDLNVYAVGEDGKAGLRGTLVSKQGQAIGKAMLAGLAQGVGQAFSSNGSAGFGGAQGGVDFSGASEQGLYGGVGSALDRVAQFYIDLANQIFPVIEISAGRPVTLVVVKGKEIQLLD
jgi:conjugal transfer pilus assembly protein TraB